MTAAPPRPAAATSPDAAGPRATAPPPGGWADVERMLDEAAALVRSDLPPAARDAAFLNRLCRGARAAGAAIWEFPEPGADPGDAADDREPAFPAAPAAASGAFENWPASPDPHGHAALVRAAAGRPAAVVPAGGGGNRPGDPANATGFTLALCPLAGGAAVLEAAFAPAEVRGGEGLALEAVRTFAEILEEGRARRELGRLRGELARGRAVAAFAARLHAAGDLGATHRTLADGGRAAAGVDRLAVASPAGGWFGGGPFGGGGVRVRAVSDAAVLDRRAGAVRSLERLAAAALRAAGPTGRDLFSSADPLPPGNPGGDRPRARRAGRRVAAAFGEHLTECGAAVAAVAVLRDPAGRGGRPGRPVGVLIADAFPDGGGEEEESPPDPAAALAPLVPHAAAAVARARAAGRGPLGRLARTLAAPLRLHRLPWTVPLAAAAAAVVAALVLVPAPFHVTARGRLVPAVSREVFAPRDGVVRHLPVRHDSPVEKGDTLAVLVDPTLDLRAEELTGEADTAAQRLAAVRAERAAGASAQSGPAGGGTASAGRLAAEERELVERLSHLAVQRDLIEAQRAELTVTSPIAGRVLTWGLAERLPGRPVPRGARLMTVADTDGPWRLELFVPDRAAGPLLDAAHARAARLKEDPDAPPLPVTFLLAADPGPTYAAAVTGIDPTVEPHAAGPAGAGAGGVEPSVRLFASLPANADPPETRPGATVVARVRCGERALGYVWLHELIDAARTRVWW